MNKYKVTIKREYTKVYEIYANTETDALEEADEEFSDLELRGDELDYTSEDKVELLQRDEFAEDPNAYELWDEWNRYYKEEKE